VRAFLARSLAPGVTAERRAVIAGILLGEDEGLDRSLRDSFRASGLYHLLSVDIKGRTLGGFAKDVAAFEGRTGGVRKLSRARIPPVCRKIE
jgi:hypothetical protein